MVHKNVFMFLCVLVLVVEFFVDGGADDVGDCVSLFGRFGFECAVGLRPMLALMSSLRLFIGVLR